MTEYRVGIEEIRAQARIYRINQKSVVYWSDVCVPGCSGLVRATRAQVATLGRMVLAQEPDAWAEWSFGSDGGVGVSK